MENQQIKKQKYVKIQSTMNITVTGGLQFKDITNKDAHVADRLKIAAMWPKKAVLIRQGQHWYPETISKWNTVKKLVEQGILTIGEKSDTIPEDELRICLEIEKRLGK